MKIGILGSSLEALYLAAYFVELEAHVTLFGGADPLETQKYYQSESDADYWFSLLKKLQGKIVFNSDPIERIQKSYLQNFDDVKRMKDTFRVVTEKNDLEFYEDFDFLIQGEDLSRLQSFLGGSAPAINEKKYKKNEFNYYSENDLNEETLSSLKGSIAIWGDYNKELLNDVLKNNSLEIHFFHQSEENSFLLNYENQFKEEILRFEQTKEVEPKRRVFEYPKMNIVSLDYLEDRERLYLTLEIPDFRSQDVHFTQKKISTIAIDFILHFRALKPSSRQYNSFLLENEPGYYKIEAGEWKNLDQLQTTAEKLKNDFLQYFTKL